MRVLNAHKWDSASGGAGRYYLNHEKILALRGHEVIPWAADYSGNRGNAVSEHYFAPRSTDFGEFGDLSFVDKLGVAAHVVWNRPAARALAAAIRHFQPDVIHFHNVYHQLSASVLETALGSGIPVVQSLHDFSHFCVQSHFFRDGAVCCSCLSKGSFQGIRHRCFHRSYMGSMLTVLARWIAERKRVLSKLSGFTTPSEEIRDVLVKCGLPRERILRIDNPFLAEEVPFEQNAKVAAGDYIAAWGTFAEMKGFGTLMDALVRIQPAVRLKLFAKDLHAASPALREKVARVAASGRLELNESLRYGESLFSELAGARVLVVPSEWLVTQEYAVWEGMLTGRPVVVGDRGGNKDLVGDDRLVFKAGDADDLASTLNRLLSWDEKALGDLGLRLRARAIHIGDPAAYAEKVEDFYRDIR